MKIVNLFLLLLIAAPAAFSQTTLIEKVAKKPGELVIPYEKYKLANGLTLVIHEDHSDPVAHVDVTYHVGSAREEIGKSGFAHFFEHMMFQGSDHVADEEHFKIVTESGGTLNGTTNRDRTNYFETLPKNQLETALWLEADRMGFLLDAVTQPKFEIQRETVKNERGQRVDNQPYGLASEYLAKTLYPYGHPYSWLTIGYIEDLNRVNVNDLKNFFMRWYGPNNAVLTVGGDVDPQEVVKLVEKYFGSIPRGPEVKDMKPMIPKLDKTRYVSYEDNIRQPLFQMVYPTVPSFHEDEVALECLADILGGGKNSVFYKNFIKTQKASSAMVYNWGSELAGEFHIRIMPFPGQNLAEIERLAKESLKEFESTGVQDDDLARFKAENESQTMQALQSVSGKVAMLAAYETYTGNPNRLKTDMAAYNALTKEDVMRVYNKYIKDKHSIVLSVVPKGQLNLIAAKDNHTISKAGYVAPPDEYKGLAYNKPKDDFDRSKRPQSTENPVVLLPAYWTETFDNGLKVIGAKNDEIPMVTMQLSVKGGHLLSANDPTKAGISALTTSLMNEDTENYTAEQMSNELKKLGSSIQIYSGNEDITVNIQSPAKNLDATMKLVEERLFRPKFEQDDFDRVKKQQLESIANQNVRPDMIANKVYNKILYGDQIFSISNTGTEATVTNITLDDVKKFHKSNFSPSVSSLVVVGDIEKEQIIPKLEFLKKWDAKKVEIPTLAAAPKITKTKLYLVDKENAAQSEIRIGYLALPYDAVGDFYKATLMNYVLGGAFNSRINLNLREAKGYTYGARSGFSGSRLTGPFTASAGVRANATDSSLVEFMKEITQYKQSGIVDEELEFLKSSVGQSEALKYETAFQKASLLKRIVDYNLNANFTQQQNEILSKMTSKEVQDLATKYLPTENMVIVVVGDKAKIKPGLEKLGYEIVEVDKEGNVIK